MGDAVDAMAAANERTLKLITTIHESMLEATKSYVSAISDRSSDDLAWTPPPPTEHPDPKELMEETFKFQSRMLEANKAFALSLAETWGQVEPSAPTKTGKTTKR